MNNEKGVPHVELNLRCPVKKVGAHVDVNINPFREKGVVTGCDHLDTGEVCTHDCLVTPEAHELLTHIITTEQLKHKKDLGTVGKNVIG